jgi:hypothetical protein
VCPVSWYVRRHRDGGRHRRGAAHRSEPRPSGIVDSRSHIQHLMTYEVAAEYRHAGTYLALCGAQVLAASLAAPERRLCLMCQEGAR